MGSNEFVTHLLDQYPLSMQEHWDNSGWQIRTGRSTDTILTALSISPDVVSEAVTERAGTIITHHPLFFKPMRRIDSNDTRGAIVTELIENNISLFSLHTPVDSGYPGLADYWADILELKNITPIIPKDTACKCVTYIPEKQYESVSKFIIDAVRPTSFHPAVKYTDTAFSTPGTGRFTPREASADPFIGTPGTHEKTAERTLEMVLPDEYVSGFIRAVQRFHPYEEPAYEVLPVQQCGAPSLHGLGRIGSSTDEITVDDVVSVLTDNGLSKCEPCGAEQTTFRRIAVLPGSGAGEIPRVGKRTLFITSDISYHDAELAARTGVTLINTSHFEIERPFCTLMKHAARRSDTAVTIISSEKEIDYLTNQQGRSSC